MSRKHNTKHDRSRSRYTKRLSARGIKKTSEVEMPDLDTLRHRAGIKAEPLAIAEPTKLRQGGRVS